uniref:Uncharacterized protein n=1 Tax=Trichogramma kaykai TaxID=54128 RepID=A0ABD2VRY0_9HYME
MNVRTVYPSEKKSIIVITLFLQSIVYQQRKTRSNSGLLICEADENSRLAGSRIAPSTLSIGLCESRLQQHALEVNLCSLENSIGV